MHIFRKHHFDQVFPQNSGRAEQPVENQIQRSRRLAHSDLCLRHWRKVPSTRFASLSVYPFRDGFGVSYLIHQSCENKCKNSDLNTNWYQKDNDKHCPTVFFPKRQWSISPFVLFRNNITVEWRIMAPYPSVATPNCEVSVIRFKLLQCLESPAAKLHHITQELLNTKYVVPLVLLISMTSMTIS